MKFVRTIIILLAVVITMLFAWQANSPAFAKAPGSASAQIPGCRGKNLLDALKTSDPKAYNALVARENAIPNGKGLLWKIERQGTRPSYLYGTMHMSDKRLVTLPRIVADRLDHADRVALELEEVLNDKKMQQEVVKNIGLIAFMDGRTLDTVLSKEEIGRVKTTLKKYNMAYATSRMMKPWFVMLSVALPLCEIERQKAGLKALDATIARTALSNGTKVIGLETVREQFAAFAAMPLEDQKKFLMNSLRMHDLLDDQIETMTQLYLQRRTAALWEFAVYLTKKFAAQNKDGKRDIEKELIALKKFENELLIKRNHVMAKRAQPLLAKGNLFIAVGALHLPGKQGLVTLLQKAGYKVSAVY